MGGPASTKPIVEAALPGRVETLIGKTGFSHANVCRHLRTLEKEGRAHIKRFVRTGGQPAAYWVAGPGKSAEPPKQRTSGEYCKVFRKRVAKAIEKAEQGKPYDDRYSKQVKLHLATKTAKSTRAAPQQWFSALLAA